MTNNKQQQQDAIEQKNEEKEYDIFRDSLLRYAGYANEIGESFRYQFPKLVTPSYMVSFGYCFADAGTTGYDIYTKYDDSNRNNKNQYSKSVTTALYAGDVLLWQSLASVMIPGFTIHTIVRASRFAVARSPILLAASVKEWTPTFIGLGSIPLIIHPIDHLVDTLLNNTTRQWFDMDINDGGSKDNDK